MKRSILFLFFLISLLGYAQDTTAFKPLTKFPILTYSQTYYGKSDFKNVDDQHNGLTEFKEYRASIQFAFPLKKKKRYLLQKFDFTALDIYSEHDNYTETRQEDFYSYTYNIGLIEILKNRWTAVGILSPTLASDFQNKISHEDFILQSSLIFTKRANRYMEYGFGVAYSTRFGKGQAVPLLTFTYKKNNWSFQSVLPAYLSGFHHTKNSKIGLTFSIFGNNYNFEEINNAPIDLDKIIYTRLTFGPEFEFKLYKALYVNLYTGISFRNNLESITIDHQYGLDLSTKSKFFGRFGLNVLL